MSPDTCHQCQQPQPQTLPLLTPPLRTVYWFTKAELKNAKFQNKKDFKPSKKKIS